MKALIDTNVWLDIITSRKPFCELSRAAILACINDNAEIFIAATSLKDIFYLVAKYVDSDVAYRSIEMIMSIASVAAVDRRVCSEAMDLEQPDYEDGIIAAVAVVEMADCIITRDRKAFRSLASQGIKSCTPEQFLFSQGYEQIELVP